MGFPDKALFAAHVICGVVLLGCFMAFLWRFMPWWFTAGFASLLIGPFVAACLWERIERQAVRKKVVQEKFVRTAMGPFA